MRRFLALFALAAVACTPATPAATGVTAPSGPQRADVQKLTIGYPSIASNFDPHAETGGSGGDRRYDIFETLVVVNAEGKGIDPMLATEWKLDNPRQWRLTLRRDAKFQDGTPLTAVDVEHSYARVQDPARRSGIRGLITGITSVKAEGDYTILMGTSAPDPLAMKRIARLPVTSKAYSERVGDAVMADKPMGSGPFKLKEYRQGVSVLVEGWKEHPYRKPILDEVLIRLLPDGVGRVTGLRLSEIDVTHQMTIEQGDALEKDGFAAIYRPAALYGLYMDPTVASPIADKRVRQALNYAVDRETLARTLLRGKAQVVGVPTLQVVFGFNPDVRPYTFDQARARSLLAAAGYPNGFKTAVDFWQYNSDIQPIALYLQAAFREIGVELELLPTDNVGYAAKLGKRQAASPLFLDAVNVIIPLLDADRAFQIYWSEAASGQRYNNPEFDRAFVTSRQELDDAKREALLKQAMAILQEDPPHLTLTTFNQVSVMKKDVAGYPTRDPNGDWSLLDKLFRTK
jgi:ABC-type transport system substrate-binding protein